MEILLGILFVFAVICIVGMILLQEGKGGGIAALGGAGMDNIVGARNPLRKLTVIFSIACVILIFWIGYIVNTSKQANIAEGFKDEAAAADAKPVADTPVAAPAKPAAGADQPQTEGKAPAAAGDNTATKPAPTEAAQPAEPAKAAPGTGSKAE